MAYKCLMLIIINFDINIYTHILIFSRWSFLHSAHQVALAHIYIIHLSEEQVFPEPFDEFNWTPESLETYQ